MKQWSSAAGKIKSFTSIFSVHDFPVFVNWQGSEIIILIREISYYLAKLKEYALLFSKT